MSGLRLLAPAKLNLDLRVVGRRDDGHHLLESRMVLLELADEIALVPGSPGLRVGGKAADGVPPDASNLAWRGLVAGLGTAPDGACLILEKRIPAAAGLGGGSSDAATAWRLGRAWRGQSDIASADELVELSTIGADVPFFAAGMAAARVGGIGERVEPISEPASFVALVHPPFGISTAAIFAELRRDEWGRLDNDLLAPARRLRPELDDLFALVHDVGGEPQLTGSGPTIFSLSTDPERTATIVARLTERGVRATMTRTLIAPSTIEASDSQEELNDDA